MMPGESGFDFARTIRQTSAVPILMLTARDAAESRITGLEIGADDYVSKPFEPRELSLRVASILRRARPAAAPAAETLRFGEFVFHIGRAELRRGDDMVRLTDREREMLAVLASAPGETVPRMALAGSGELGQRARGGRAGQPPAAQDREGSDQSADRADRARYRIPAGGFAMTTLDLGIARLRSAASRVSYGLGRFNIWYRSLLPKGLYARALLIIIAPMVILQSVVAFVFMERHWNMVTRHLSAAVVGDIAALSEIAKAFPQDSDYGRLRKIAQDRMGLAVDFLPITEMPPPGPKPFFSLLDQALSVELRKQIGRPFWIDTVGRSSLVEIRVQLDDTVMRVFARRSAAYASNSEIFLLWMVGTSLVLLAVAIGFLRNQIKPILRLADAAESFGKGREMPDYRPRGAREVRRAAQAFIEMKIRIERAIEQRTAMLAGVSHDLRTVLTRFKLELVLLGDSPEVEAMKKDVDEMGRMLEAYLAFARGDTGEQSAPTDMADFLDELKTDAERNGHRANVNFHGYPIVTVKPAAFKRCLANLVSNAARFADTIEITGHRDHRYLTVTVDDDGPGIPVGDARGCLQAVPAA